MASRHNEHRKSYGKTFAHDNARVHLGDVSQDVNIQGPVDGGLHLHFHASPATLSLVAVIVPLFDFASSLSSLATLLAINPPRQEHVHELPLLLSRLPILEFQLRSSCVSLQPHEPLSNTGQEFGDLALIALQSVRELARILQDLSQELNSDIGDNTLRIKYGAVQSFLALWTEGGLKLEVESVFHLKTLLNSRLNHLVDDQASAPVVPPPDRHGTFAVRPLMKYVLEQDFLNPEKPSKRQVKSVSQNRNVAQKKGNIQKQSLQTDADNPLLSLMKHEIESLHTTTSTNFSLNFTQDITALLHFREEQDRYIEVKDAHHKTFGWIFNNVETAQRNSLGHWLQAETDCFWINGKAGSGKSTLMKYIHRNPQFSRLLGDWAHDRQLVVCSFFFWYAGHPLQKSQEGVLRSLLRQVIDARPALTPILFPRLSRHILCSNAEKLEHITMQELQEAIQILSQNVPSDLAVCILVDGVDEFTGDHFDFSKFLVKLARGSRMKLIVSSRPISACHQVFSAFPFLRLQDVTAGDIRAYIHHELIRDQLFTEMSCLERGFAKEVENALTEKCSGVFLWIVLVVRKLLVGLGKYDDRATLLQKIDELPTDLEKLYDHMFAKMSREYQQDGSRLLRLVSTARSTLFGWRISALQLYAADRHSLIQDLSEQAIQYDEDEADLRIKAVDGKLRSRCCGLLEVQYSAVGQILEIPHVDFLHRTVYDYLHDEAVWNKIVKASQMTSRDVFLSLLVGYSHDLKRNSIKKQFTSPKRAENLLSACIAFSQELSQLGDSEYVNYMEIADVQVSNIEQSMHWMTREVSEPHVEGFARVAKHRGYNITDEDQLGLGNSIKQLPSMMMIAGSDIPEYLDYKLSKTSCTAHHCGLILLHLLNLFHKQVHSAEMLAKHQRSIRVILKHGTDPNLVATTLNHPKGLFHEAARLIPHCDGRVTPWNFWIFACTNTPAHLEVTLELLRAGARTRSSVADKLAALSHFKKRLESWRNVCYEATTKIVLDEILSAFEAKITDDPDTFSSSSSSKRKRPPSDENDSIFKRWCFFWAT